MNNNKEPQETGPEEMPFNMAMIFYFRLNRLLEQKDMAFVNRDLHTALKTVECIYRNIVFKIKKKEKKTELKDKLLQVGNFVNRAFVNHSMQDANHLNENTMFKILGDVDEELMILMDNNKMIFPDFQGTYGLGNLRNKYGI